MEDINITQGGIIAAFIFLALSLIRIIEGLLKQRANGKESKTPEERRFKNLELNKVEKEFCNERHDNLNVVTGEIKEQLKEGTDVMGGLQTTSALLSAEVLKLTEELSKLNNIGGG